MKAVHLLMFQRHLYVLLLLQVPRLTVHLRTVVQVQLPVPAQDLPIQDQAQVQVVPEVQAAVAVEEEGK